MQYIEKSSAGYEEMIKTDRKIVQIALDGRKDFNEKLTKLQREGSGRRGE